MSNSNDQRILELKKQIELKKEKLGKSARFTPITNCSLELHGTRHNLNVLDKEKLLQLLVMLNSYYLSAKDLAVLTQVTFSGYKLDEWLTDINAKLNILSRKSEEQALKVMEDKLLKLLSDGKKVELEIDEIEAMLK